MNTNEIREIIRAIRAAQAGWTGWDWAQDFGHGDPRCPVCRGQQFVWYGPEEIPDEPDCECEEAARRDAIEFAERCEASARAASECGDEAAEALRRGDIDAAREALECACSIEREYGDCPEWRVPLRLLLTQIEAD